MIINCFKLLFISIFLTCSASVVAQEIDYQRIANKILDNHDQTDIETLKDAATNSDYKQNMLKLIEYEDLILETKQLRKEHLSYSNKKLEEINAKNSQLEKERRKLINRIENLKSSVIHHDQQASMYYTNHQIAVTMNNVTAANNHYRNYKKSINEADSYAKEHDNFLKYAIKKEDEIINEINRFDSEFDKIAKAAKKKDGEYVDKIDKYTPILNKLKKEVYTIYLNQISSFKN